MSNSGPCSMMVEPFPQLYAANTQPLKKMALMGQKLGTMIKMLFQTLTSHLGMLGFESSSVPWSSSLLMFCLRDRSWLKHFGLQTSSWL